VHYAGRCRSRQAHHTIEAIGATSAGKKIQQAWIELEVPQCGYCQSGQIMSAAALLAANPKPTDGDIDAAMSGTSVAAALMCRIREGIKHAAHGAAMPRKGADMISRRQFLSTARVGRRSLIGFRTGPSIGASAAPFVPNAFIRIGSDGQIVLTMPYVEMGQAPTPHPYADRRELEVDLKQVRLEHAPPTKSCTPIPCSECKPPATRMRYAVRGSRCARPVRPRGPCSCRGGKALECRSRFLRAQAARCATHRRGDASNMASLPPTPRACLSQRRWCSRFARHRRSPTHPRTWTLKAPAATI